MFAINENSETKNKTKTRQVRDQMVLNGHLSVIQYCKNERFSPVCIIEGLRWPPGTWTIIVNASFHALQNVMDSDFIHRMTYMATPLHKNPYPGLHKIFFGRPFLGHYKYTLCLSYLCPRVEKRVFNEVHKFYIFYSQIRSLWDGGHEIYN